MTAKGLDIPPPLKCGRGDCGALISTTGTASAPNDHGENLPSAS